MLVVEGVIGSYLGKWEGVLILCFRSVVELLRHCASSDMRERKIVMQCSLSRRDSFAMVGGRPKKDENTRARGQSKPRHHFASLGLAFGCLPACLSTCTFLPMKFLSRPKSSQLVRIPAYHRSPQMFDEECRKVNGLHVL